MNTNSLSVKLPVKEGLLELQAKIVKTVFNSLLPNLTVKLEDVES